MIETKTSMTLMHFHDFYYLMALQSSIRQIPDWQFRHSVRKLANDVDEELNSLASNIAIRVFTYLFAACFGEARHARSGTARDRFAVETLSRHRHEIFADISSFSPSKKNLNALVSIFDQEWRSGYGGRAWKKIAEALVEFDTTPAIAWVDHVVDLEHNNGTAFNKEDASDTVFFDVNYPESFSHFLDYKFSNNILQETFRDRYGDKSKLDVTPTTHKLVVRYSNLSGKKSPSWLFPKLESLKEYNVIWGNQEIHCEEKWTPWIGIASKNEPTVENLFHMTGLDDIFVPNYTEKKLKHHVKTCVKDAKEKSGKYWTKAFAKEVKLSFEQWYNQNVGKAKMPKAKKTYAVLPVTIQFTETKMIIIAHVHYQGIGRRTINDEAAFVVKSNYSIFSNGLPQKGFVVPGFGKCVVQLDNKQLAFKSKELEALLD